MAGTGFSMPRSGGSPIRRVSEKSLSPLPASSSMVYLSGWQRPSSLRVRRVFAWPNELRSKGRGGVSTMIAIAVARAIAAGFLALALAMVLPAQAQQPSANAIALAKEIITAKGGNTLYDPVVPQIIDRARSIFLQSNPTLGKDLNDVAAKLRAELTPRVAELI